METLRNTDAALQEATSFLRGSQGLGMLVPISAGEIIPVNRWPIARNFLTAYSWSSEEFRSKALQHLGLAEEMANLGQKQVAINHLEEVFNHLLLDRFSASQIQAEEFWWYPPLYRERTLDDDRVELPGKVYEILQKLKSVGLPLQTRVLVDNNPQPVDPIFVVSLFGRKWFKLHEW